jgi:hypothetical protein
MFVVELPYVNPIESNTQSEERTDRLFSDNLAKAFERASVPALSLSRYRFRLPDYDPT